MLHRLGATIKRLATLRAPKQTLIDTRSSLPAIGETRRVKINRGVVASFARGVTKSGEPQIAQITQMNRREERPT